MIATAILCATIAFVSILVAAMQWFIAHQLRERLANPGAQYLRDRANELGLLVVMPGAMPHLVAEQGYTVIGKSAFDAVIAAIVARGYSREEADSALRRAGFDPENP